MTIYQVLTILFVVFILICFSILLPNKNITPGIKYILVFFLGFILIYTVFDFPVLQFFEINEILINFFVDPIQLVFAPLIYLFFRWMVVPEYDFETGDLKLLLPFFLVLVVNIVILIFFALDNINLFTEKDKLATSLNYNSFSIITSSLTTILYFLQFIVYAFVMVLLILKKAKERQFSDKKSKMGFLRILWIMIVIFIIFSLIGSISFIIKENEFIFITFLVINILLILFSGINIIKIKTFHESFKI